MLWILDTDHVSLFQRGHPLLIQRLSEVTPDDIVITIITVEEQLRGRLQVVRQMSLTAELILAYNNLKLTFDSLKQFSILSFTAEAHTCYVALLKQKIKVGKQDLRIAAIALSVNAVLVTCNQRDFTQVPGLAVMDWTQ
jgi:tRNA(fMet)-specific endonuclease VapC